MTERAELLEPYGRLQGGKRVRSRLVACFNRWVGVGMGEVAVLQEVGESLHTASLLIDDLEDGTPTRRGQPAAHVVYGAGRTINAANYVYFEALTTVLQLGSDTCSRIFAEEMVALHHGQGLDILWRERGLCPSLADYKRMVAGKTGGLLRMLVRMLQALAGAENTRITQLATELGVFYQMRDDLLNVTSEEYMKTRGAFADDLTEGKFSLPVVLFLENPANIWLLPILKRGCHDDTEKRRIIACMSKEGTLERARTCTDAQLQQVKDLIAAIGDNAPLFALVSSLELPSIKLVY